MLHEGVGDVECGWTQAMACLESNWLSRSLEGREDTTAEKEQSNEAHSRPLTQRGTSMQGRPAGRPAVLPPFHGGAACVRHGGWWGPVSGVGCRAEGRGHRGLAEPGDLPPCGARLAGRTRTGTASMHVWVTSCLSLCGAGELPSSRSAAAVRNARVRGGGGGPRVREKPVTIRLKVLVAPVLAAGKEEGAGRTDTSRHVTSHRHTTSHTGAAASFGCVSGASSRSSASCSILGQGQAREAHSGWQRHPRFCAYPSSPNTWRRPARIRGGRGRALAGGALPPVHS